MNRKIPKSLKHIQNPTNWDFDMQGEVLTTHKLFKSLPTSFQSSIYRKTGKSKKYHNNFIDGFFLLCYFYSLVTSLWKEFHGSRTNRTNQLETQGIYKEFIKSIENPEEPNIKEAIKAGTKCFLEIFTSFRHTSQLKGFENSPELLQPLDPFRIKAFDAIKDLHQFILTQPTFNKSLNNTSKSNDNTAYYKKDILWTFTDWCRTNSNDRNTLVMKEFAATISQSSNNLNQICHNLPKMIRLIMTTIPRLLNHQIMIDIIASKFTNTHTSSLEENRLDENSYQTLSVCCNVARIEIIDLIQGQINYFNKSNFVYSLSIFNLLNSLRGYSSWNQLLTQIETMQFKSPQLNISLNQNSHDLNNIFDSEIYNDTQLNNEISALKITLNDLKFYEMQIGLLTSKMIYSFLSNNSVDKYLRFYIHEFIYHFFNRIKEMKMLNSSPSLSDPHLKSPADNPQVISCQDSISPVISLLFQDQFYPSPHIQGLSEDEKLSKYIFDLKNGYFSVSKVAIEEYETYLKFYMQAGFTKEARRHAWLKYNFQNSLIAQGEYALNLSQVYFRTEAIDRSFNQLNISFNRLLLALKYEEMYPYTINLIGEASLLAYDILRHNPSSINDLIFDPFQLESKLIALKSSLRSKFKLRKKKDNLTPNSAVKAAQNPNLILKSENAKPKKFGDVSDDPISFCSYISQSFSPDLNPSQSLFNNKEKSEPNQLSSTNPFPYDTIWNKFNNISILCGSIISYLSLLEEPTSAVRNEGNSKNFEYYLGLGLMGRAHALYILSNLESEPSFDSTKMIKRFKKICRLKAICLDSKSLELFSNIFMKLLYTLDIKTTLAIEHKQQDLNIPWSIKFWSFYGTLSTLSPYDKKAQTNLSNNTPGDLLQDIPESPTSQEQGHNNEILYFPAFNSDLKLLHPKAHNFYSRSALIIPLNAISLNNSPDIYSCSLLQDITTTLKPLPDYTTFMNHSYEASKTRYPSNYMGFRSICKYLIQKINYKMEFKMTINNHSDQSIKPTILELIHISHIFNFSYTSLISTILLALYETRNKNYSQVLILLPSIWKTLSSRKVPLSLIAEVHFIHGKVLVAICSQKSKSSEQLLQVYHMQGTHTNASPYNTLYRRSTEYQDSLRYPLSGSKQIPLSKDNKAEKGSSFPTLLYGLNPKDNDPYDKPEDVEPPKELRRTSSPLMKSNISDEARISTPPSASRQRKKSRSRQYSESPERPSRNSVVKPAHVEQNQTYESLDRQLIESLYEARCHIETSINIWERYGLYLGISGGIQQMQRLRESLYILMTLSDDKFTKLASNNNASSLKDIPSKKFYFHKLIRYSQPQSQFYFNPVNSQRKFKVLRKSSYSIKS